ncbi:GNAT family N-acetyltransferase [Nocardia sp. NPDC050408]|uniref:GNAT family N-acetyltransferase n=1 Tax=Nocardia sp. NPDC050408 TaxID=3364319 RepID=UPI0037B299E0
MSEFDRHVDDFTSYQETPWGRLRYEQVFANLARHLPDRRVRVLDAGGGNGIDAVRLARAGHHVSVLDTSSRSLHATRGRAAQAGVEDRIECHACDIRQAAWDLRDRQYDIVLLHNVVQYLQEPASVIGELVGLLRTGGLISILAPNPSCDPLAAAVRRSDLDEALRLLNTTQRESVTYGLEYISRTADEVVGYVLGAGMNPPLRYGVRAVCDLIADDEAKHDPVFFDKLLRLENAVADRRPYLDCARFFHLIATKPEASTDTAAEMRRRRVPMNIVGYEARVRTGGCFICEFLAGTPGFEHETVYDDGEHVGFLNKYPTLPGYVLVVPRRHVEDVVRDLTPQEYLRLQSAVHTVARGIAEAMNPERLYLFSMGSNDGNAHIHWHIAPLPPGVPYREQQFHAVAAENGILAYSPPELAALADRIRTALMVQTPTGPAGTPSQSCISGNSAKTGRLVVIRGNSGSGKTTVARQLQRRFDRGRCLVIGQDVVRREFLRESDVTGGYNIDLLRDIATLGLERGLTVVVEGILTARRYGTMLAQLAATAERACFYAFDLTFADTVQRHSGRRAKTAEFDRDDMRHWYHGWDPLGFVDEVRIDAAHSLEDIVDTIYADITPDSPNEPVANSSPPTAMVFDSGADRRPPQATPPGQPMVLRCWGTSHTEHLVATSSRLTDLVDLPDTGDTVSVDGRHNAGFVARLETVLALKLPDVAFTIHNHGRGGATSRDLLADVVGVDLDQDLALLECGTNDVLRRAQGRDHEAVDIEEFTRNYRTILEHLQSRARRVICLAAPPVGGECGLDAVSINQDLFAYNLAARKAAHEAGAMFVDYWGAFVTTAALLCERDGAPSPWLADGIHLSDIGDELILRSLEATLIGKNVITGLLPTRTKTKKPSAEVVIRPARVEDVPSLVRLRVAVAAERKWIGAQPPINEDKAAARLSEQIAADTAGVIVGDHRTAGVIAIATADFTTPGVAEITMMIAADHRGVGVGGTLLHHLLDWCKHQHGHKATLKVWPHNLPAIKLYHSAGFETEGTLRAHYRRRNGELWDAIIMSRLL